MIKPGSEALTKEFAYVAEIVMEKIENDEEDGQETVYNYFHNMHRVKLP